MSDTPHIIDNAAWDDAAPRLSVLIPFLRDDPRPLLSSLAGAAAGPQSAAVEIVLLDDGSGDDLLATGVAELALDLELPIRFLRLARNEGRAKGRNRLASHARARHLLFLDSDMRPDSREFLAAYLGMIQAEDPPVVFGGFSVEASPRPEHALHRALAERSDCLPAVVRARTPEKYVFTSNLLVRRDVFETEAFDEGFRGWGWEDVEWGMRVARRYGVRHVDNPATHLGLDSAETLAVKYEQSAANFARLASRHPEVVAAYPSYRMARLIRRTPGRALLRRALKRTALARHAPLSARVAAMKAYRAALYAEVI